MVSEEKEKPASDNALLEKSLAVAAPAKAEPAASPVDNLTVETAPSGSASPAGGSGSERSSKSPNPSGGKGKGKKNKWWPFK